MNPVINTDGEIALMCDDEKVIGYDGLESWQIEELMNFVDNDSLAQANGALQKVDHIINEWMTNLTIEDWQKIQRQRSLYGIDLPKDWIKVWRIILKEPDLRDNEKACRNGNAIGSYAHLWAIWASDCINKYLSDMEKELLYMVDCGYLYCEIGDFMVKKYGDEFWKPRKDSPKTTPSQVVNNYLYWKMPNKIVRRELTELILLSLNSKGFLK